MNPDQSALFTKLATDYGISTALSLLPLLSGDSTTGQKAFTGAKIAGSGVQAAGKIAGEGSSLSTAGKAVGPVLGAANLGWGLSNIASADGLSNTQKAGLGSKAGFDFGVSFIPVAGQIYAAAQLGRHIGEQLEKSNSPQVSGAGRAIHYTATPTGENAFWDVATGMRSPSAAVKAHGGFEGGMLDTMGPVGSILRGLGVNLPFLHHEPTTGTKYRDELSRIFGQIAPLKGTDTSRYTLPTGGYEAFSPEANSAATNLGKLLAPYAKDSAKNPEGYALQTRNILLNTHGNNLPGLMPDILKLLQKS